MTVHKEVEPILIASVKQNRLLFSTTTFRDILSKVGNRPVSVVSLIYSDGEHKQSVFNECLNYLGTLDVNHNKSKEVIWKSKSNTDRKGIYVWAEPTIIRKSCEEVAVILTELNGCFDPKTATRDDLMLFALNCIISSTLIYGIEEDFSDEIQEFLQLFSKYGKGGISSELGESYLNLILLINNWKPTKRYSFGYHESSTCPSNSYNFRKERLNFNLDDKKKLNEEIAFKNKHFVEGFHKIGFCLMPGNHSKVFDCNSNPLTFNDFWQQTTVRLFHPSNISVKRISDLKFTGHNLVQLFERICTIMTQTDTQGEKQESLQNQICGLRALSVAFNYYQCKMNKEIEDKECLKDNYLSKWHNQSKKNALKLLQTIRGMNDKEHPSRDQFYNIFDNEIQNFWEMYEQLNRFKFETLNKPRNTKQVTEQMVQQIIHRKKEFDSKRNELHSQISRTIGFSLDGLTTAVRSTLQIN